MDCTFSQKEKAIAGVVAARNNARAEFCLLLSMAREIGEAKWEEEIEQKGWELPLSSYFW